MSETSLTTDPAGEVAENHRHSTVGPDYRTTTVPVRGGQLRVGVWGPREDSVPTVLAVHGVSASHRSFGLLAEALPGVRVLAPDLRGRGRSNALAGPYGMPSHADDLAEVIRELADGPLPVVGHSMGAFATTVLADRHPDLVTGLILVDGGLPLRVPEGLSPDEVVRAVLGPVAERLALRVDSVDEYRPFWTAHPALGGAWTGEGEATEPGNHGFRDLMEDYLAYDLEPEGERFRPSTRYEAMAQDTAELQGGTSLLAALAGLRVPATLLWTDRGLFDETPGLFTAGEIAAWQQRYPALAEHLTVRQVPACNHYTIVMAPEGARQVADEVRRALA